MPLWLWLLIVGFISIRKLRYITVDENNISIRTLGGRQVLEYRDIEWINQNIFGSNWYILSIKYKASGGGSDIIFVFPEMYTSSENVFSFDFGRELNITSYIREQIIKANPAYSSGQEPSRWWLFKWTFLSAVPFALASYLLLKFWA